MNRYLVFASETYYAGGGAENFQKSFEKEAEAKLFGEKLVEYGKKTGLNDWAHVFDLKDEKVIVEFGYRFV